MAAVARPTVSVLRDPAVAREEAAARRVERTRAAEPEVPQPAEVVWQRQAAAVLEEVSEALARALEHYPRSASYLRIPVPVTLRCLCTFITPKPECVNTSSMGVVVATRINSKPKLSVRQRA